MRRASARFSDGIARGKARPVRQKAPRTAFSRTTSCMNAPTLPAGSGSRSVRSEVSVSARRVYGITNASHHIW